MADSRLLCVLADIPDGGAISRHVESATGGFQIILMRRGRQVFAYHNECPHQGRHLDYVPGKFLIKNAQIICAAHGATFAVESGSRISGPCSSGLVRFPVQLEGDAVRLA
ncbi:MAG: Rieske 2Fe-2S domain-containing protein [Rhodanobacteraceae bacterium]|jgi:nitrite reductase/ring-hydroxylating ferredoxin subunit|nr:Rieske 2Fe-2S domain-containing protein [Rhodanobacteraceae bacterium]